jgi:hypothetical protein
MSGISRAMDLCANAFLSDQNAVRRFEMQLFGDEVAILRFCILSLELR